MSDDSAPRHRYRMAQAGEGLKNLTERIIGKKSNVLGQMLFNWRHIVGDSIGKKTIPLKLSSVKNSYAGATLYLSVKSAYACEITQTAPSIIEKINSFVGYNAVSSIRLVHLTTAGDSSMLKIRKEPRLSEEKELIIDAGTETIADERLKQTLKSFGRRIMANENI